MRMRKMKTRRAATPVTVRSVESEADGIARTWDDGDAKDCAPHGAEIRVEPAGRFEHDEVQRAGKDAAEGQDKVRDLQRGQAQLVIHQRREKQNAP